MDRSRGMAAFARLLGTPFPELHDPGDREGGGLAHKKCAYDNVHPPTRGRPPLALETLNVKCPRRTTLHVNHPVCVTSLSPHCALLLLS